MITALNAIPVKTSPQIELKDILKTIFPVGSDTGTGVQLGVFLCHFGELLRRKEKDVEVSNIGITDEKFREKMFRLLIDAPTEVTDFVNQYFGE